MEKINKNYLKNKKIKRTNRKIYEWQDMASRFAKDLGIVNPSAGWFKLFRDAFKNNKKGLLTSTYSAVVEIIPKNAEKYFYKVYHIKANDNK